MVSFKKFRPRLKSLILCVVVLHEGLFFCINALLKRSYLGSNSSASYRMFLAILVLLLVGILFHKKRYIKKRELIVLTIPILFVTITVLSHYLYGYSFSPDVKNALLYVFVWQYMGIIAGIIISRFSSKDYEELVYYYEIFVLILCIGVLYSTLSSFASGNFLESIGGATYQSASYYAALSFGFNLYYLSRIEKLKSIFGYSKIIQTLRITLLVLQAFSLILAGGRGAMILLIVYTIYTFLSGARKIPLKTLVIIGIILLVFIIVKNNTQLFSSSIFSKQLTRVFSYLSRGESDITRTSGRESIYLLAWEGFKHSPLVGNGLLSYYTKMHYYPHNIFLELLFEGGIIYFTIACIMFFGLSKRYFRRKTALNNKKLFIYVALYPICMLMFSGTYSYCMTFWLTSTLLFLDKPTDANKSV